MGRFKVDFNGVMDRLEELECENHRLRAAYESVDNAGQALMIASDRVRAENVAMRPFAEALRDYAGLKRYADPCEWCGAQGQSVGSHTPDCLVTAAATFLTKHPATDTAGEAESEDE